VAFEVALRNHKKETFGSGRGTDSRGLGNVTEYASYEKVSARLIRFDVPVAKDKEAKVKYRIRFKY